MTEISENSGLPIHLLTSKKLMRWDVKKMAMSAMLNSLAESGAELMLPISVFRRFWHFLSESKSLLF